MNVVGLIPARAGSKRLPNKNLLQLAGRPLIEHTCLAAVQSGVCDAVYLNTDSVIIAAAAERCGVRCPVLRPADLATDSATTRSATLFMLDQLARNGERFDAVMILQPTSPLRTSGDIRAAWALFEDHHPCSVVSVSPIAPSSWTGRIARDGQFDRDCGDERVCRLNGAIYIHLVEDYLLDRPPRKTIAYVMPPERGVDIDTGEDFAYAEFLLGRAACA